MRGALLCQPTKHKQKTPSYCSGSWSFGSSQLVSLPKAVVHTDEDSSFGCFGVEETAGGRTRGTGGNYVPIVRAEIHPIPFEEC